MGVCETCGEAHDGAYGSGRFCSERCARSFSTRSSRSAINVKVSETLRTRARTRDAIPLRPEDVRYCPTCGAKFVREGRHPNRVYCSIRCRTGSVEYLDKLRTAAIKRAESPLERARLRDIGRMGGFGMKGFTAGGTRFESRLERNAFAYLENRGIPFEAHKHIPESAKVSDVYLPGVNVWVELDGIDRERKREWLGRDYERWHEKLKLYSDNGMTLVIARSFDEFKMCIDDLYGPLM